MQHSSAPWPYGELDPDALRADGWRPVPVRELVLKVHQRCDLACDYCYVYRHADQSWRDRPARMPADVRAAVVASLGRHVRRHRLPRVRVVVHGGEPLLYGPRRLGEFAAEIRAAVPDDCLVDIGVQTNGMRLDDEAIAEFRRAGISVGVSVDGVGADHDRHRRTRSGHGSYTAVSRALERLAEPENRESFAGILCTVAAGTDPVATYRALRAFHPPHLDLLLPHANWANPPAERYGPWLTAVFDAWYEDGPDAPRIRLFEAVMSLLLGGASRSEQVGLSPSATVVVETDGRLEQVDALKTAYPGACATGFDIRHDELDAVLTDPGIIARQIGAAALAPECLKCPLHPVCGAGHYAHRYRPGQGFRNPSVYCADLRTLIEHVRARLTTDVRRLAATGAR